jgi:hypothetical protein
VKERALIFQHHWDETGKQPGGLTPSEIKALTGHLEGGWVETIIVNQYYFNSLVSIVIIVITLNAWR